MSICGPVGEQPVVHHDLEVTQVERLVDVALGEPSHHAATRFLLASLPELDSPFLGLRNIGLLATQELKAGVPERSDWSSARRKSQPLLKLRGRRLVEKLGFEIHTLATNASMLTINGRRHAVAVFCDEGETFETASRRFGNASPVSQALALADRESVDWVLLTRSSEIRLYSARLNAGVGRKGRTETYVELNLSLLPTVSAGYLHLLFSADALTDQGTLSEILDRSADFAAELAVRLRERVYHEAVPALARAVAARLSSDSMAVDLTEADLADAYEQVMVILFRLLFVAYAEDKDLLPYRSNGRYADHSLSRKAQRLTEDRREGREEYDGRATSFWDGITKLWDAVNDGNSDWRVPAYNGGLFSSDPKISPSGAALTNLSLTNAEFAPVLAAILIDDSPEGPGPVDFRSLSVREFGTIYEGLLESKLSVAPDDLTVKKVKGDLHYVPAGANEDVEVKGGEVYFHNRSGARKATGSYFTKPFAVEHLLDHALEPALDDHLTRLGALRDTDDDAGVAAAFFDFRCADIAMGSAHFLVSAVDRIEARLSAWLSLHPVPAITAELNRLRDSAMGELGDLGDGIEIETGSLLRRQIARHCVYGVDKNRVAVELARLAIWVHTFVPGLPLSFLDHNLVHGDSLTGIGTLDEVVAAFDADADPTAPSLFRSQLIGLLRKAEDALQRLAHTSDASKHEIDEARAAHTDAREAVAGARAVFDVVTAHRAGVCGLPENFDAAILAKVADGEGVRDEITRLMPVHFPAAFPEVFLRDTPGFDCLIGNPPWEKVMVERKIWWGRYLPGIRSLPEGQMNARIDRFAAARPELVAAFNTEMAHNAQVRSVILNGPYPGIGRSHPDLYKAFAWRNWHLSRPFGGHVGLVLPRTAVSDAGMAAWRKEIVGVEREREREGLRIIIATLVNHKGWVFEGIHNSYTVALAVLRRRPPLQLVSTPGSGLSTMSMAATASPSSRFAGLGQTPSRGGGFEAQGDEPCVAIYPGPAISLQLFHEIVDGRPQLIPVTQFGSWSDNCAFPQLPTKSAFQVFLKMREAPSFGESKLDPQRRARVESDAQPSRAEPSRAEPSRAEPSRAIAWCKNSTPPKTSVCSDGIPIQMELTSRLGVRRRQRQVALRTRRRKACREPEGYVLARLYGEVVQHMGCRNRDVRGISRTFGCTRGASTQTGEWSSQLQVGVLKHAKRVGIRSLHAAMSRP